jgi:hemerythrin-like domain-containing protein
MHPRPNIFGALSRNGVNAEPRKRDMRRLHAGDMYLPDLLCGAPHRGRCQLMTDLIEVFREEHRNVETLLLVLEREFNIFDRAEQPDYEVVQAVIDYFRDYPDLSHHPKEEVLFAKLKARDPAAAAGVGDLEAEHRNGAKRLRLVARAVESVLSEQEVLRQTVDDIVRDFIEKERRHMQMEERVLFPAAAKALLPEDWAEIDARLCSDPSLDRANDEKFNSLRERILRWEQESTSGMPNH